MLQINAFNTLSQTPKDKKSRFATIQKAHSSGVFASSRQQGVIPQKNGGFFARRIFELAYYFAEAGAKANGHTWDLTADDFLELCTIADLETLTQAVAALLGGDQKKSAGKAKP